jgi:FkbM family methyltransferase
VSLKKVKKNGEIYELGKGYLLALTPKVILWYLKRIHYLRVFKNVSETTEKDLKIVRQIVKSGEYVVDIGSNIGIYTAFLSGLVGEEGRVFSIEPVTFTFDFLRNNVKKTKKGNVVLLNYAISQSDGELLMEIPKYTTGGENYYQARICQKYSKSPHAVEAVQARRLDSLLGGVEKKISFVKCDVEGHELECIGGASGIISQFHPIWLIEISGNPDEKNSKASRTFELLESKGYEGFWFDGRFLRKRGKGDMSVNYFFLTKEHLQKFVKENEYLTSVLKI